jgi:hypothetical protein
MVGDPAKGRRSAAGLKGLLKLLHRWRNEERLRRKRADASDLGLDCGT